jgi:Zn-finger nucleic acid-binding protein
MMLAIADFQSACEDVAAGKPLELGFREDEKTETPCPRCGISLVACKITFDKKDLKLKFLRCERDGVWCGPNVLTGVFAVVGRRWALHGGASRGAGSRTGNDGLPVPQHVPATAGLAISAWRDRPRKRPPTATPIDAYRDHFLACPACPTAETRELRFAGDRWSCRGCHGAFVERGALEALVEEMASQPYELAAPAGETGTRACPVCMEPMVVEKLGDSTTIDRCAKHGLWFDAHELQTALVEIGLPERTGLVGWLKRLF